MGLVLADISTSSGSRNQSFYFDTNGKNKVTTGDDFILSALYASSSQYSHLSSVVQRGRKCCYCEYKEM